MNRRGLFKLLGAAFALPFLPKPKKYIGRRVVVDRIKLKPFTDFRPYKWRSSCDTITWNENDLYRVHWDSARVPGGSTSEFKLLKDAKERKMLIELERGVNEFCDQLESTCWQTPV